jgi:hypothetical protein
MARVIAGAVACAVLSASTSVGAEHHVVPIRTADARLVETSRSRQRDLAAVTDILSAGARTVSPLPPVDISPRLASSALARLTDDELRDLAERARVLTTDPEAAGTRKKLLIIAAVLAVLFLLSMMAIASTLGEPL